MMLLFIVPMIPMIPMIPMWHEEDAAYLTRRFAMAALWSCAKPRPRRRAQATLLLNVGF